MPGLRSWRGRRVVVVAAMALVGAAQASPVRAEDGGALFKTYCASCHEAGGNAPGRDVLGQMTPEQILQVLEKGAMKQQAAERSRAQRRAIAEYLSGKPFGSQSGALPPSAYCTASATPPMSGLGGPMWNGWGAGTANTRFQPESAGGLTARTVPGLKLKWAFGLPGASSGGTQPVVVGGRLYVGDAEGDLFALNAKSGCIIWRTEAEASIRSAVVLAPRVGGALTAYFGDQAANVYAADAATGKILWRVKVDEHPAAAITAALAVHAGRLYVPVSSREESRVGDPHYVCCTFRGSVLALDADTGKQIWKTYTIGKPSIPGPKNSVGTPTIGPSGDPVWNTPTVDAKRGRIYIGTGNNYSEPSTPLSDAVLALDMASGRILWRHQFVLQDIWNGSCMNPKTRREVATCPDADAPDTDFSSSPVLTRTPAGKPILVVGNKSAVMLGLDPDHEGRTVWTRSLGRGRRGPISVRGGVLWGLAVAGDRAFIPNDFFDPDKPDASGEVYALSVADGRQLWAAANPPCGSRKPCKPSHAAAVTAIPGAVFSGTMDGRFFAYAAEDGRIIWSVDTAQDYPTVNGVKANGGSMSNAGATVAGGMLYVNSGYSHHQAVLPGNVLLAFAPPGS